MNNRLLMFILSVVLLGGCGGAPEAVEQEADAAPILLVAEDLVTVQTEQLTDGPVISGSLQPEVQAALRAEVAGVVLEVVKDNGDLVAKGDLLVRIDPTAIRGQLLSAQAAERAASVALEQAERQYKRMQEIGKKGLVATEAVEVAQGARNQALSERASTRARVVEAQQQLEKTEVRAPFAGVIGSRSVSAGDTAQMGMQLLSVLDVGSMRFVGMVAADQAGRVEPGTAVRFRVNGYAERTFEGQVQRVNPVANESTRQVQVLVSLPADDAPTVAGLYAEGRIAAVSRPAILLPESAVVREGDAAFVWQFKDDRLARLPVQLGERDARLGRLEITSGVSEGDRLLKHPIGTLKDGAAAKLQSSASTTKPETRGG